MSIPFTSIFKTSMSNENQSFIVASATSDIDPEARYRYFTTGKLEAWIKAHPDTSIFSECCGCGRIQLLRLSEHLSQGRHTDAFENAWKNPYIGGWDVCTHCGPECNRIYGTGKELPSESLSTTPSKPSSKPLSFEDFPRSLELLRCCWCWALKACATRTNKICGHNVCCECESNHVKLTPDRSDEARLRAFMDAVKSWDSLPARSLFAHVIAECVDVNTRWGFTPGSTPASVPPTPTVTLTVSSPKRRFADMGSHEQILIPPAASTSLMQNPLNQSVRRVDSGYLSVRSNPGSPRRGSVAGPSNDPAIPDGQPQRLENNPLRQEEPDLLHRDSLQKLADGDKNSRLVILDTLGLKGKQNEGQGPESENDTRLREVTKLCIDSNCDCQVFRVAPFKSSYTDMGRHLEESIHHIVKGAVRDLKSDTKTWLGALETLIQLENKSFALFEVEQFESAMEWKSPEEEWLSVFDEFVCYEPEHELGVLESMDWVMT